MEKTFQVFVAILLVISFHLMRFNLVGLLISPSFAVAYASCMAFAANRILLQNNFHGLTFFVTHFKVIASIDQ